MGNKVQTSIEIHADIKDFDTAHAYVEDLLERTSASKEIARETALVFETLFESILAQGLDSNTPITISTEKKLGRVNLKIGYEGKMFAPPEIKDGISPELALLESYAEKISYSYASGFNTIRIAVLMNPRRYLFLCGAAIALAVVFYAAIYAFTTPETRLVILDDYVFPLEQLYANAILMIGAPVTFFSLLKNTSDSIIISERILNSRRFNRKSVLTSIFAVLLALGLGLALTYAISDLRGYDAAYGANYSEHSFAEMVVSLIPPSIFEPFETISPIPLIIVALLVTNALTAAGKNFNTMKTAIDTCYELFSHMLRTIMAALPLAVFLACLDIMLDGADEALIYSGGLILFILVSSIVLFATYALRLKLKGEKVGPFIKKLPPLLRENRAIGSAIDAVPFNVRYCARHFGMDRKNLARILSVLAQINRDGNCFLLMLSTILFAFIVGVEMSALSIAVISALVLFLSFGAPNQPGSILIGMLFVVNYLGSNELICTAILLELCLGGMQNMINVIGDIVIVAEEQKRDLPHSVSSGSSTATN
ncbi:MAG: cation:dicarboxylase symporter family transporter [Eggerthellaceae bacterium]|nr:cation:dicarboxylase symporter family transporter [Eggerthellaceae bacterium]